MTDQRKDEMPERMLLSPEVLTLPITRGPHKYTEYVRVDLSPPVPDDALFKEMIAGYEQDLFENDHSPLSKTDKLTIRCFFDFIEAVGYLKPSPPVPDDVAAAIRWTQSMWEAVSNKAPQDEEAMAIVLRAALQSTRKPPIETLDTEDYIIAVIAEYTKNHVRDIERFIGALKACGYVITFGLPPVPVDTINIKRETLQEIKYALHECTKMLIEAGFHKESGIAHFTTRVLASLDAVLSEGE